MSDFQAIADEIARDIACGRLRPGERLPPQREFAWRRGIAVSTASRVYAELGRRGLVAGEVGRGTYVRSAPPPAVLPLAEPSVAPVDLELIFPVLDGQDAKIAASIAALVDSGGLRHGLRPVAAAATRMARELAAGFLARPGWTPAPGAILFAGNGRQAIAAAIAAVAGPGDRVAVEALTYPLVKGIGARLGISLVPVPLDADGLDPEALARAHRAAPLKAVYLQPGLHNPLGCTMSAGRRAALAGLLRQTGLVAVEDAIYAFLADEEPLAALAPDQVILVDSLSKRVAPGLTLGFLAAPAGMVDRCAAAIRSGGWTAAGFPLAAGLQMIRDGTASRIAVAKRADAAARQAVARAALPGLTVLGDPRAYHLWLEMPQPWRAEAFAAAAAARHGIAVTPGSAFATAPGHAPTGCGWRWRRRRSTGWGRRWRRCAGWHRAAHSRARWSDRYQAGEPSVAETWAATTFQPTSGKFTQVWLCRPIRSLPCTWNSRFTVAKRRPRVRISRRRRSPLKRVPGLRFTRCRWIASKP